MNTQPLLVLFGDSLILDSVEASLADRQTFSVLRLRRAQPEITERLQALTPTLIIFDLDTPCLRSILPFLKAKAGVPLLGVDINGNIAVSLTCTHHCLEDQADLWNIIRTHAGTDTHSTQPVAV